MLAWLLGKPTILIALAAVIAVACWGTTCQCRKILYPPEPRPPRTRDYEVVRAETGASLTVKAGRKRTNTVYLAGIAAPPVNSKHAEASRQNLERLAGGTIRVETTRTGLFRGEAPEEEPADDVMAERAPIVGIVYGSSGVCLNRQQVAEGWATCNDSAPAEWWDVQKDARKNKRGLWKE